MDNRKELLLASAARLYTLGIDLEAARERLKQLVDQGISFDSDELKQAYQAFAELDRQWKTPEQQHLALREELLCDPQAESLQAR